MSIDEHHVALPKLYGGPAYARPAAPVATQPRPFDPDDLPIEAFQSEEDRAVASSLPARAWAPGGTILDADPRHAHDGHMPGERPSLRPRPLSLRTIAGRLLGGD